MEMKAMGKRINGVTETWGVADDKQDIERAYLEDTAEYIRQRTREEELLLKILWEKTHEIH